MTLVEVRGRLYVIQLPVGLYRSIARGREAIAGVDINQAEGKL